MNYRKHILLLINILLFTPLLFSQKKLTDRDYKKHPYWIEMIKDPNVNYFEAVKAYDLFWSVRKLPKEEDNEIGQSKKPGKKHDEESEREERRERREKKRERALQQKYGLECKKFEHWKMTVKPYVQEDGSILTREEQLKLHEQQR